MTGQSAQAIGSTLAELSPIIDIELITLNELAKLDPKIAPEEFTTKQHGEVFKQGLITMLTLIHV